MNFIGIDIGTTSISGAVLNLEKKKIEIVIKINNNSWIKTKNDWEKIQDVHVIAEVVKELLNKLLLQTQEVKGIGITGQMHGILYLDKNGNVLSPLYTWQDGRSKLLLKNNLTYTDELKDRTGCNIFPGYGFATHYYNMKNNLTPESARYISTIADYIAMFLGGKKIPVIDYNNAASFGFFNLDKMQFDYSSLDKINMDCSIIPEVVASGTIIGELENKCLMVCATGDNQASILGSTSNVRESVNVNIGTGGQVNIFSDKNTGIEGIETRPYFGCGYIHLGASLCGGSAYALLEKFFGKTIDFLSGKVTNRIYDRMDEVDSIRDYDVDRIKVDTRFEGTRINPSLRGSIQNITMGNFTPQSLVIGFQEGIVEELYGYYKLVESSMKIKPKQLAGAGNGIRNNKLIRLFIEKIFGMPLKLTEYTEETAIGAAMTAAAGLGHIDGFLSSNGIIDEITV